MNERCKGCKHIEDIPNQFCYIFKNKPKILPCGQHDMYAKQRKKNGKLFRENPLLFSRNDDFFKNDK